MRLFWMVMRFTEDNLATHPNYAERNVYYINDPAANKRGDISQILFPSLALAEREAARIAQKYPLESIIVLQQQSVFELPELPAPIKKKFNSSGELVPDA